MNFSTCLAPKIARMISILVDEGLQTSTFSPDKKQRWPAFLWCRDEKRRITLMVPQGFSLLISRYLTTFPGYAKTISFLTLLASRTALERAGG